MSLSTGDIWVPELEPTSSRLLQAALDNRSFRIGEYEGDGEYPEHRAVKEEIEHLASSIVERNGSDRLVNWAQTQPALMRGYAFRGPEPYDPERDGARVAAMHRLDVHIWATVRDLAARAVFDPAPTDRTYATVPGLFDTLDKRFLLPLATKNVDPVWSSDPLVLFNDYALYAHPLVRDNRELVADLMALVLDEAVTVRLAVDPHAVVPREGRPHVLLLDYWYGVIVDQTTLDDPRAFGHTRHERRIDRHDSAAMPMLAVDVYWSVEDDLKTLEVVETVPAPQHGTPAGLVFNRYLHAIRNWRDGAWVHVDGAVKAHALESYEPTIAHTTAAKGPSIAYRKLWRVDGTIDDRDWGRLLGHHFRDNELVIEAFGSILDERTDSDGIDG